MGTIEFLIFKDLSELWLPGSAPLEEDEIFKEKCMKISGTFSGFIWSFGERIFAQTVSAIVGIVLARILLPNEYETHDSNYIQNNFLIIKLSNKRSSNKQQNV